MGIQKLVRDYYTKWEAVHQWRAPNFADCLDFMATEVAEAIDKRLRCSMWNRLPYVRNNESDEEIDLIDIATEVFDAIMMGCIALDILGFDLMEVAQAKLEKMDAQRMG